MRSRKEWRNRDASVVDGVMALLDGLRAGLHADVVALVDDDRSDAASGTPPNFWDALDRGRCADLVWDEWYRTLRGDGRATLVCGCGAGHLLQGFLIHGRWALLIVPGGEVRSDGVAAVMSCVRALGECLPPGRSPTCDPAESTTDGAGPVDSAEPLTWWVRRQPH